MKVTVAKSAGFCFGVRRAVEQVYHQVKEGKKPVYTYGPIIHNDQVVRDLEALGVRVIHAEEELDSISEGTVIVRSHGVPRRIQEKIEARGLELVDATCPFVKKIHRIVMEESRKGAAVIIAGDESHPEVEGIRGWAEGPVWVVSRPGDMERLPLSAGKAAVLVAQTTFNYTKFEELVEIFSKKGYDGNVINTVCNATEERQSEARRIARTVDAMIGFCGDLKFGRTVHSLIKALSRYDDINYIMISPEELQIPEYLKKDVFERKGIPFREVEKMEEVMPELDIIYMTRVQRERFFNEADYVRLKDSYILDMDKLKNAKEDLSILHPLPRVNEISVKVDQDPRACYFRQALNGKHVRMALIMDLLGVSADED